jgi:4-carboxymuconolactone decarboxylase
MNMARVPYVKPESGVAEVDELYAEARDLGRPIAHLYQALANQPPALRAFLGMSHYVRDLSSLPPALRELAILTTARALDQPSATAYEWAHHARVARRVGVTEAQLLAVEQDAWERFPSPTREALAYASEVTRTRSVTDATFANLASVLALPMLTDLVITVAWYHLCGAILGPLKIDIEDELR